MDGVEIVAVAGMEKALLESIQQQYNIPHGFARWEDLLELGGLHVLSEKPLARDGEEGAAMVAAARKAGRVLDVVFNHRRRGDVTKLKSIIDAGELGRPYYAKASWLRRRGIPTLGSWFTNPELSGGGPLADIGVRVLDYALHLLGEPRVISVSASVLLRAGQSGPGRRQELYCGFLESQVCGGGFCLRVYPARRRHDAAGGGGLGQLP